MLFVWRLKLYLWKKIMSFFGLLNMTDSFIFKKFSAKKEKLSAKYPTLNNSAFLISPPFELKWNLMSEKSG